MTNNLTVAREEEKIPFGPSFQEYDNPFYYSGKMQGGEENPYLEHQGDKESGGGGGLGSLVSIGKLISAIL